MSKYKISILVPIFNMQKYLRECLYSISNQTLKDIQIICINDGSSDLSEEIITSFAKHDDRIVIISKPNSGYGNSMNIGLEAADGEYIGIVEPDDFIDKEMYENLYSLAIENDADVVRSNYYRHKDNTDSINDEKNEYLNFCEYDIVFCPKDSPNIFFTEPSTCTSIYKNNFIKRNDIHYLETPGASFQDTFFNYQVLALANKMILTKDAYHHYRINEGSSVLSPGKIFCVCDEFESIWKHVNDHEEVYSKLKYVIPRAQYNTYLWNLDRLPNSLKYDFFSNFSKTFKTLSQEGLLNANYFDLESWSNIREIIDTPDEYFISHYGPIEVKESIIVSFPKTVSDTITKTILRLVETTDNSTEILIHLDNPVTVSTAEILDISPRIKLDEDAITECNPRQIDLSRLQGSTVTILHINIIRSDGKFLARIINDLQNASKNGVTTITDSYATGSWNKKTLLDKNLPIWEPMLFIGLYEEEIPQKVATLPNWLIDINQKKAFKLDMMNHVYDSFKQLYEYICDVIPNYDYQWKKEYYLLFSKYWKNVLYIYNHLNYDDRIQYGNRPSPEVFSPIVYKGHKNTDSGRYDIAIIIPAYNVEAFLDECLESVLTQIVPSMQIICINDASEDKTLEILEKYSDTFENILVISQFNGGAGSARNRGIKFANSEYLTFIDPDDYYYAGDSLYKLLKAANENQAKVCGGSLEFFRPDGSIESFYGGERYFYRINSFGFQKFDEFESDYAAWRFIFHSSIFNEHMVKFPELRWYEDPVFLTRVMKYCDRFFGIPDVVYRYRSDYKKPNWDVVKVRDMLKGLQENINFALERNLDDLYSAQIRRIDRDYLDAITQFITDEEVFSSLTNIQSSINIDMFNGTKENKWRSYLLKPFYDLINHHDSAIVRVAKKAEDTSAYHLLQNVRKKIKR